MGLSIITYNVNGIRAAIKKGLLEWIADNDFDIINFQETKAQPEQLDPQLFESLGYQMYWKSAEKKGYSGVATLSRLKPERIVTESGMRPYDIEGRILRLDFDGWTLLNCYFPSGTSSEERHKFKQKYLKDFHRWINELKKECDNLIVVGDYNIVHQGLDIHNPERKDNPSGYRPEERAWMSKWFNSGFTDVFRHKYPERIEFSWWSYRAGSRDRNKGWRIDYQSVSSNLSHRIIDAYHLKDVVHSDHCPLYLHIDLMA